jgi:multiple sugar transport system permease protein
MPALLQPRKTIGPGSWWDRHQRRLAPVLMLAPAVILFSCLVAWPIFASIRLSFFDWDGIGPARFIGLGNYRELFADTVFQRAAWNNALWVVCFMLAPACGLLLAIFLNRRLGGMRAYRTLFLFPFVLSQAAVGLIFTLLLGEFGPLAVIFRAAGLAPPALLDSEQTAIFGIILAALWPQVAYCMILYLAGLAGLNGELIDAARLDGAHGWKLLRRVVMPQLRPSTVIAIVVSIVAALRSFDLASIMTNGGPANGSMVIPLYMYQQTFLFTRYGYGAAIAVVLFLATTVGIGFFLSTILRRRRGD